MKCVQIKSNLLLHLLYYTEACNELVGPISASLRPHNTDPFEETLQRCEPLATLFPVWRAWNLYLRPFAPETNALPLDLTRFDLKFIN